MEELCALIAASFGIDKHEERVEAVLLTKMGHTHAREQGEEHRGRGVKKVGQNKRRNESKKKTK